MDAIKWKNNYPNTFIMLIWKRTKNIKNGKKAEDKKFDDKCWWDSLDKNKKKEYVDKYGYRSIEWHTIVDIVKNIK